jgi:hypothetical protein
MAEITMAVVVLATIGIGHYWNKSRGMRKKMEEEA